MEETDGQMKKADSQPLLSDNGIDATNEKSLKSKDVDNLNQGGLYLRKSLLEKRIGAPEKSISSDGLAGDKKFAQTLESNPFEQEGLFALEEFPYFRPPTGRITLCLSLTAAASIFGSSLPHGWNTGVLNSPAELIQSFLNSSYAARYGSAPSTGVLNLLWSMSVSVYLIGGCVGAFSAGWLANRYGRRGGLLVCHSFGFIAAILFGFCKLANSFEMLIIARIIVGFGCGASGGLVPMFLTEIAPVNIRGAMGVLHQFAITMGILLSQLLGLSDVLGNEDLWPVLLALTALPCLVSLVTLPWLPESPRYLLVDKEDEVGARQALVKFRGHDDVDDDIDEMLLEKEQAELEERWTFKQLLSSRNLRTPLMLVCFLNIAQQLSGINVVFYYSTGVFAAAGIPISSIQYAVLGTGFINVMMTGISVPLMEKSGRRPLLLWGMVVMTFSAVTLTVALKLDHIHWMAYVSVACFIGFVIGFAIGLGSIPQFIGAELFKQGPRPPAMSLAGFLNWLANFTVGIAFPFMQMTMGPYSFIPFLVVLTSFGFVFYKWLPETKGKTYDEIYNLFVVDEEEAAAARIDEIPDLMVSRYSLASSRNSLFVYGASWAPNKELGISPLARETSFTSHENASGRSRSLTPSLPQSMKPSPRPSTGDDLSIKTPSLPTSIKPSPRPSTGDDHSTGQSTHASIAEELSNYLDGESDSVIG